MRPACIVVAALFAAGGARAQNRVTSAAWVGPPAADRDTSGNSHATYGRPYQTPGPTQVQPIALGVPPIAAVSARIGEDWQHRKSRLRQRTRDRPTAGGRGLPPGSGEIGGLLGGVPLPPNGQGSGAGAAGAVAGAPGATPPAPPKVPRGWESLGDETVWTPPPGTRAGATAPAPPPNLPAAPIAGPRVGGVVNTPIPFGEMPGDVAPPASTETPRGWEGIGVTVTPPATSSPPATGSLADADAAYERGDYPQALRLYRPLARAGNPEAEVQLGAMYEFGQGVPHDDRKAAEWYRKAAEQGYAAAESDLCLAACRSGVSGHLVGEGGK